MNEKEIAQLRIEIGERLRRVIRDTYGPHREQYFANEVLKISQGSLSDIINGKYFPAGTTLYKIMTLTDLDVYYIMTGESYAS